MMQVTTANPDLTRCYWCGTTQGVSVYINGWDNGTEIALCAACFASPYARDPEPARFHDLSCDGADCPGPSIAFTNSGDVVNVGCPCDCHTDENGPDACAEHPAGCGSRAHVLTAAAL